MTRTRQSRLRIAVAILCLTSGALTQDAPAPVPTSLDEMIAAALKTSPEVLLMEARLRQAQAELNQARLKVTREVITTFNEKKQRTSALESVERRLKELTALTGAGSASPREVSEAKLLVGEAQLKVAQSDAEMRYLLGVGTQVYRDHINDLDPAAARRRRTVARPQQTPEALVEPLGRQVKGPFAVTNLGELTSRLAADAGVSIIIDAQAVPSPADVAISMAVREPLPLSSALHALADQYDLCFLLRDYGIFVTKGQRARAIRAPAIPDDTPFDAPDR
jgi:hypothetical protein